MLFRSGGIGISYNNKIKKFNYKKYNNAINKFLKNHNSKIIFEPGRSIIGNAGLLISKIIYIKQTKNKDFIILDTAMNDLIRPALYGAKHQIIPAIKRGIEQTQNGTPALLEFITDKEVEVSRF